MYNWHVLIFILPIFDTIFGYIIIIRWSIDIQIIYFKILRIFNTIMSVYFSQTTFSTFDTNLVLHFIWTIKAYRFQIHKIELFIELSILILHKYLYFLWTTLSYLTFEDLLVTYFIYYDHSTTNRKIELFYLLGNFENSYWIRYLLGLLNTFWR